MLFQDIMPGTVTHHSGLFVTYHSGSHPDIFEIFMIVAILEGFRRA